MTYDPLIHELKGRAERDFYDLEISNKNIANISTPGYKVERPYNSFDSTLDEVKRETQRDMEAGKLQITQKMSDVTLDGKGFFLLQDKEGNDVLTRNLDLHKDKDGNLVTGLENYQVLPNTKIDNSFIGFEVKTDGELLGIRDDKSKVPIKKLAVVNFPESENLNFDGNVYRPTKEAGNPNFVSLGKIGQTMVRQGAQELSNVDAPMEFNKFKEITLKLSTISRLNQLLNSSERQYINSLVGLL